MRCFLSLRLLAVLALGCSLAAAPCAWAQNQVDELADERKLLQALQQPVELIFDNTPFKEAIGFIAEQYNLRVYVDERRLDEDSGVANDTPVTLKVSNIQLQSALNLLLEPLGCAWTIHRDSVYITTADKAETMQVVRIHPAADLISGDLRHVMTTCVDPDSWQQNGGIGSFVVRPDSLVVRQSLSNQGHIARLFTQLRNAKNGIPASAIHTPAEQEIDRALAEPVELSFSDVPLSEVADYLSALCHLQILIDREAINNGGLSPDTSIKYEGVHDRLDTALAFLLEPYDLAYQIKNEVLVITTPDQVDAVLYPQVLDLAGTGYDETNYDALAELLTTCVDPESWAAAGGNGQICAFGGTAVVYQSRSAHREIARTLNLLREQEAANSTPQMP